MKKFSPLSGFASWKDSAHDPEPTPGGVTTVRWLLVLAGMAGDGLAFYFVINVVASADPVQATLYSGGFASVAIGLAHAIGTGLARIRWRDPKASRVLSVVCVVVWVALGAVSFVVRLQQPSKAPAVFHQAAVTGNPFTAALLFAALFLASGMLAVSTAYLGFNPLRMVIHRLRWAVANEASSRAALLLAEQDVERYQAMREQEQGKWRVARSQVEATMHELKNHARYLMAVGRAYPPTTEGLTKDGPRPNLAPPAA